MRRALGENAPWALAAAGASAVVAWIGLYGFAWNDYEIEAKPAVDALIHGHLAEFLRLAPAYGGSLIERAPFALLPGLWGGGALAVYRALAVPSLLAAAALAVWLCAQMRHAGRAWQYRALVICLCIASPLAAQALELGHPEEILGACLCVAAVLLASRGHCLWAGALLGLAIANKDWALVAAGPVGLALASYAAAGWARRALACASSALIAGGLVLAPLLLGSAGSFAEGTHAATLAPGGLFQPWQAWWFFGWHGAVVQRLFGAHMAGYRTGPQWAVTISHPLIVVVALALSLALWLVRRRANLRPSEQDALLALALALLLRCMLDTWDTGYYMLPFLVALLSWETLAARRRAPLTTLFAVVVPWSVLAELSASGSSPDLQAALFLLWTVPLAVALALTLYAPGLIRRLATAIGEGTQETTASSLGSPLRSS